MQNIKYSQNSIAKRNLAFKLVDLAEINNDDTAIDIGAGRGRLTEALLQKAKKVIAIEIDEKLSGLLKQKFHSANNLEILNINFMNFKLPNYPYKVFANIPFKSSSAIITKLTEDKNFKEGYIVLQKEAAMKLLGKPVDIKNQMASSLLKPWYELKIIHKFKRTDFEPIPKVDSVLLKLKQREISLISENQKSLYIDFIYWFYNKNRASYMKYSDILEEFNKVESSTNNIKRANFIKEAAKIKKSQLGIQKIHRTRVDKNWRKIS